MRTGALNGTEKVPDWLHNAYKYASPADDGKRACRAVRELKHQGGAVFHGPVADALVDGIGHPVGQVGVEQDLLGAGFKRALAGRRGVRDARPRPLSSAIPCRSCCHAPSGGALRFATSVTGEAAGPSAPRIVG